MKTLGDLAHSLLTGQWRLDRALTQEAIRVQGRHSTERNMRLYAGAEPSKNRPMPAQISTPEDYKQAWERIVLIRGARQLEEDFPFFDGILGDFETFVVGDLKYRANTGVPEADRDINDYLDWQFSICDMSNRLDIVKLARLSMRSYKRDGECGHMIFDTGDSLKLSSISGDRIGNPTITTGAGPNDFNGIVVDLSTGAPIEYNIYRRLPKLNSYVFQQTVRPNDFIHLYELFRFEQYHGVTVFKNGIENGFDMKQISDFTRLNIKYRASQLPYVTNEQGTPRGSGYEEQPAAAGSDVPRPLKIAVDGVEQNFFKLGEGVMEYPNDFPNQQYSSVMTDLKRDCAIGAKLPLEFCYRSDAGGVVQRFYLDKAMATFAEEKRWLKHVLLNPFKNRCIQKGVQTGLLNLKKYGIDEKLVRFKGSWQMGRAVSVDYGREVDADIKLMDAGVMSPQDYVLETQGRTVEEVRAEIEAQTLALFEAADRIAKKTGQPVNEVVAYIVKKFPNPANPGAVDEGAAERKIAKDLEDKVTV